MVGLTTVMSSWYISVDRLPVRFGSASKRVYGQLEAGGANGVHVDDVPQVADVRDDEVFLVGAPCLDGRRERHALHAGVVSP